MKRKEKKERLKENWKETKRRNEEKERTEKDNMEKKGKIN